MQITYQTICDILEEYPLLKFKEDPIELKFVCDTYDNDIVIQVAEYLTLDALRETYEGKDDVLSIILIDPDYVQLPTSSISY
jgi:hypothetical protein